MAADSYLQEIRHLGLGGNPMLSESNYAYDAIGNIKTWRRTVSSLAAPQNDTQFDEGPRTSWLCPACCDADRHGPKRLSRPCSSASRQGTVIESVGSMSPVRSTISPVRCNTI